MSDFERLITRIEALPKGGEGISVGEIAERVLAVPSMVVSALEEIAEREEKAD